MVKPLKIAISGPYLHKKGITPNIKNFFSEITRADHKLSETFSFIKISHVLAEL